MAHEYNPAAEEILDKEIKVLDHGFVRLIDYMGGDQRIVEAARVSYGQGTNTVRNDQALIDYLIRHQHTSPFEHVILEIHCKLPIFVARQWVRHRTARINEISGRYSVMDHEFYVPDPDYINFQSKDNKQGRSPEEIAPEQRQKVLEIIKRGQENAFTSYTDMLEDDIARELARINLPLSLYTQWYWQMDLHNLFHFLNLRMDKHAQLEIRCYANAIAKIAAAVAPMAYASFENHIQQGQQFSAAEIAAINRLLTGKSHELTGSIKREFEDKLGLNNS